MKFHAECILCLMESSLRKAESVKDPALRLKYMQGISEIMAHTDADYDSAPLVDARLIQLRQELLGIREDYTQIKHDFNQMLLKIYDRLKARVDAAEDPVYAAIQMSMAGNYIDYGVVRNVTGDKLEELIEKAADSQLDAAEYARFTDEISRAKRLVFMHDNCGEVVMDKLLIETLNAHYPQLHIISMVRGSDVLNDATIVDAREVGLDRVAEILENGGGTIAGTQLDLQPAHVLETVNGADLLIAKGQGNFETLIGCGLNIYYLFLCKCDSFMKWFGVERYSGVFMNERRLNIGEF